MNKIYVTFSDSVDEACEVIVRGMVHDHFGSEKKTDEWMRTGNPLLGGRSPLHLISSGRGERVIKQVHAWLEENHA